MDFRKTLLIVGALLLATILAFAGKMMISSPEPAADRARSAPKPAPAAPRILVATRALPVGTILTPDSYRRQPWPAEMAETIYFLERNKAELASINGRVVRTAISAGQPLTQGALVKPGDRGFLAAALAPGMRAVTVPVSALSGVAGFVFPGDRVDLMLTQTIDNNGSAMQASETILRNLKVLATDQRTNSLDDKGKQTVQVSSSVTFEVTPKMAEKISVALTMGQLSLALRAITDGSALDQAIAAGKVKLPPGADLRTERKLVSDFASRPEDGGQTYSTGADVSVFRRRYGGRAPNRAGSDDAPVASANAARANASTQVRVWRAGVPQAVTF